jgi:hypothetical protein
VPGLGGTLPGFGTPQGLVGRLGGLNAPDNLVHGLGVAFPETCASTPVCGAPLNGGCFLDLAESVSTTHCGWTAGGGRETMFAPHCSCAPTIVTRTSVSAMHVRTHTASFGIACKRGP